jgi:nucleotide-binding universal stress UspA family protein
MAYRRIIVGTDGSSTARRAVDDAAALAAAVGADLVVVSAHGPEGEQRARADAEDARALAAARGLDADAVAVAGAPADVLVAEAARRRADLVVTGSKGMADASRFLLGSVANEVTHAARCDVLIVHTGPGDFRRPARSGNIET